MGEPNRTCARCSARCYGLEQCAQCGASALAPGAEFWNRPKAKRALQDHDWCALLTGIKEYANTSQQHIAEATGVSQALISRIMAGRVTDPSFNTMMAILRGLGAPALLADSGWQAPLDTQRETAPSRRSHNTAANGANASDASAPFPKATRSSIRGATPPSTVEEVPVPSRGDDEVKRRAALQLITALAAGAAVPPGTLETVFSGIEDALGNPLDLDEWERTVHEYGQQIMTQPAGALVNDLTADIIAVGDRLQRQRGTAAAAGLLRISAGLSGLLAIDLGDAGDKRAARISWSVAKRAADASGDQELRVWVRGRGAQDALWAGRPGEVVAGFTAEAIAIADGTPSPGLARAYCARADMAADQGDAATALDTLEALKRTFDLLPPSSDTQSVLAFRESQLRWSQAHVQVQTGDKGADATLARALSLYPTDAHGPRDNLALMQATGLVRSREINTGIEQAITILERSESVTAGRTFLARQLLRTLPDRARALPAARELRALASSH